MFVIALVSLVMLATAIGDEAIVVVDDRTGCVSEGALQQEIASLPTGNVLSVVYVERADGGGVALVTLGRPNEPAPLSRVVSIEPGACNTVAAVVARIVARHLETLPITAWPSVDHRIPDTVDEDSVVVEAAPATDDDLAVDPGVDLGVDLGVVASVVGGLDGFRRVSLQPTLRGLVGVGTIDDVPIRVGLDGGLRLGAVLPIAVDDGSVAGGDVVASIAVRTMVSRFSARLGVEGGVLVLGDGKTVAPGPTANILGGLGVSFSPLWIEVVAQVPLVRAVITVDDDVSLVETPLYLGLAIGGFVPIWP